MLYSITAPETGGETQFCDMAAAYDNLDEAMKRRIDGIRVAHKYGRGKRRRDEPPANPIVNDEQDSRVPPVWHPLVMPHPVTGRKALYALGHGAHAIEGMAVAEAEALLDELKDHALEERHIYRHKTLMVSAEPPRSMKLVFGCRFGAACGVESLAGWVWWRRRRVSVVLSVM